MGVQHTLLLMLSWTALAVGIAGSVVIAVDNRILGYRQPVKEMELVWPVTALYGGPAAVAAYWRWGRPQSHRWRQRHGRLSRGGRHVPVLIRLCRGGIHCVLGTIIAEVAIFAVGVNLAGGRRWIEYASAYCAAVAVGVVFRYARRAQQGRRSIRAAVATFARADLACISASELALFIWLAVVDYVNLPMASRPHSPVFWFFLQIGLIIGFVAARPPTWWLHHRGVEPDPPDVLM
jgi:hypothetical protein